MQRTGTSTFLQSRDDADEPLRTQEISAPESFTIGYIVGNVTVYRLSREPYEVALPMQCFRYLLLLK